MERQRRPTTIYSCKMKLHIINTVILLKSSSINWTMPEHTAELMSCWIRRSVLRDKIHGGFCSTLHMWNCILSSLFLEARGFRTVYRILRICKAPHAKRSESGKKCRTEFWYRMYEPIHDSWLSLRVIDRPRRWVRHLVKFWSLGLMNEGFYDT